MMNVRMRASIFLIVCISMPAMWGCNGKIVLKDAHDVKQCITFSGYPMNAMDQTISWFGAEGYLPNQIFSSANQSPFHVRLQEMLGVKIAWQFPIRGTPSNQSLNLIIASGDLPNVIFGGLMADAERYIEEGTFWDLTPYIKEWSPAYWKLLQSNPDYDRTMKTDSGKYYGYGFFREDGGWNDTYLGPIINKAWLDECGLPMPATISDWDITLRVFKEKYGATLSFAWSRASIYGDFISGAWGSHAFASFNLYIDKNLKIQLANMQPEYREQLKAFAEWWKDGLVDQNFLSVNDTMMRSNAMNKKMGISFSSMGQLSNWIQDARNQKTGAEWVGLRYPTGDDGTLVQVPGGLGIGSQVAVISTSCPPEKLELVMRALDYAYTPEGHLYWNFGKQGVSWDYGPDGKPAYLPLVTNDPNGLNDAIDKYGGSTWSGNCIQATALLHMKNTREAVEANDLWFYSNQDATWRSRLPNGMTFTTNESTRVGELVSSIATYVDETAMQLITGRANFNIWDSYVAKLNSMGVNELLQIYQKAYDRYLAR